MRVNEILKYLEYDKVNGGFVWKCKSSKFSNIKIGDKAGQKYSSGYRYITLFNKRWREHRLVWEIFNGDIPKDMVIDHINMIKDDNRIENLRLVNKSKNNLNNKSNCIIYKKDCTKNPYLAKVKYKYKTIEMYFPDIESANRWVIQIKREIFNEGE